jgi:hypothetical protein
MVHVIVLFDLSRLRWERGSVERSERQLKVNSSVRGKAVHRKQRDKEDPAT